MKNSLEISPDPHFFSGRDELGREILTTDERLAASGFYSTMQAKTAYDAVSNRRHIAYNAKPAGFSAHCRGDEKIRDDWHLSAGPEGQFWSLENPLSQGYAEKYGLPIEDMKFDFIEVAVVKPGSRFITREAPGIGRNGGGGIEVVVNPGEPKLQYFHMPWEPEYDPVKQIFVS